MTKNFEQLSAPVKANPERRARIEQQKRAIQDVLALAELREAQHVTQQQVAQMLGVSQANVSRIEHQDDVYLSTLSNYITALGGHLEVTAIFPEGTVTLLERQTRRER
jgi:transcriptional regulator with XRE-family HTH domain